MSTKQTIKDLNEEGQFFSQFAGITENDLESFKCGGKSKKVQKEEQGGKQKKAQTDMDNDDAISPTWLNQSVKDEQKMRKEDAAKQQPATENKKPQPYSEWKKKKGQVK